jgi:hypothetical protein
LKTKCFSPAHKKTTFASWYIENTPMGRFRLRVLGVMK